MENGILNRMPISSDEKINLERAIATNVGQKKIYTTKGSCDSNCNPNRINTETTPQSNPKDMGLLK